MERDIISHLTNLRIVKKKNPQKLYRAFYSIAYYKQRVHFYTI